MITPQDDFRRRLAACEYPGYVYGYPHKKAYRPLDPPWSRADAWRDEDRRHLYCYVHVPFCRQRCSFCNLFTYVPGRDEPTARYLDALARDMEEQARVLGTFAFARLYLGGGTPTYLNADELRRLFRDLRDILGVDPTATQGCIEASPETLDDDRIGVLRDAGVQRVSLGVQSFVAEELRDVNRRFDFDLHARALDRLGTAGFPELNLDLIYGLPGQTRVSWFRSLGAAVASPATGLFLYPLYVRPLTGLDRRADREPGPDPVEMHAWYDESVARLAAAGFRQQSMRQFHRGPAEPLGDDYRCQDDGMVGLGAGARSYTRRLHYSTPWKMASPNIRAVIDDYCTAMEADDFAIRHGFVLNDDERLRRWLIQSLFAGGVDWADANRRFEPSAFVPFRSLFELLDEEGCVVCRDGLVNLTPRGVRHSDLVATLFFSPWVQQRMAEFEYDT